MENVCICIFHSLSYVLKRILGPDPVTKIFFCFLINITGVIETYFPFHVANKHIFVHFVLAAPRENVIIFHEIFQLNSVPKEYTKNKLLIRLNTKITTYICVYSLINSLLSCKCEKFA